ncbi:YceI [Candidatus Koribacter versatilis Ellin345]|uniref:YceI n=1 Tax=Koribacter versatilis (strain Ellin345) TaxID=204669 RepID=Q1IK98_KORVE|nr:YceI family protein [Candidatus Koribacter versatilis]ABF42702.1 YceI [Candidatus Koribacter versatilis Ellin345]
MSTVARTSTPTTTWNIDPIHSVIEFKVRHMMISTVRGQFTGVSGVVILDNVDVTQSQVNVTIEAASLDTRDAQRDAHLKSSDFFGVEEFPHLTFHSERIERAGSGVLNVFGDLTIRAISLPVVLMITGPTDPVRDLSGNTRIGISGATRINRKDFGLNWNAALDTGGVLVGEEVTIALDIELILASS